jgi:hypothetical protein
MSDKNDTKLPLDDSFYDLQGDELAFFQEQTGIKDEEELKKHIISVQEKAYEVGNLNRFARKQRSIHCFRVQIFGYRCIRRFGFTQYARLNSHRGT